MKKFIVCLMLLFACSVCFAQNDVISTDATDSTLPAVPTVEENTAVENEPVVLPENTVVENSAPVISPEPTIPNETPIHIESEEQYSNAKVVVITKPITISKHIGDYHYYRHQDFHVLIERISSRNGWSFYKRIFRPCGSDIVIQRQYVRTADGCFVPCCTKCKYVD